MDVTMAIVTGGGKKTNSVRHSKTLKEVMSFEEAIEDFRKEFGSFFPQYRTLDQTPEKKRGKKHEGQDEA